MLSQMLKHDRYIPRVECMVGGSGQCFAASLCLFALHAVVWEQEGRGVEKTGPIDLLWDASVRWVASAIDCG